MKWTVPILMLLTMTMSFSKGIIWLEYAANKDFISKNLCINKAKPKLHCNGKCLLMKKMAEEEKEDTPVPAQKLKIGFDETDLPKQVDFSLLVKENKIKHIGCPEHSTYITPVFPIFHPPA